MPITLATNREDTKLESVPPNAPRSYTTLTMVTERLTINPPKGNMVKAESNNPWRIRNLSSCQSLGSVSRENKGNRGTKITLEIIPNGVCTSKLAFAKPAATPVIGIKEAKNKSV